MSSEVTRQRLLLAGWLACSAAALACPLWTGMPLDDLSWPGALAGSSMATCALMWYVAMRSRHRSRAQQTVLRRLATLINDGYHTDQPEAIMRRTASEAAALLSAGVEVELWPSASAHATRAIEARVVRAGPPADAAARFGRLATSMIISRAGDPLGVIRVWLQRRGGLTASEHAIMRVLAEALAGAAERAMAHVGLTTQALHAELRARRDALTCLSNRTGLIYHLRHRLRGRGPRRPALAILDLDGFKEVNDTVGHLAGDKLLCDVARRLAVAAAAHHGLVARLGGDEFAVVFWANSESQAVRRAEAIVGCLDEPCEVDGLSIIVRGSTGVAVGEPRLEGTEMINRADLAMYRSKRSKVPVVLYRHRKDSSALQRRALAADLRRATAQEFAVLLEPIVHLASGEVLGCEAVAQWHHPAHGVIEPSAWLDLVDKPAHLMAVTRVIVDQALSAASAWVRDGLDVPVAVNIPPRCLLEEEFPSLVLSLLKEHDLDGRHLALELNEGAGISRLESVDHAAGQLRQHGIWIAIDGFGSSHSSLKAVTRIPINAIKVDGAVVAGVTSSERSGVVIRAATQLGRDLGITVVAEAVDTPEQRLALWNLGCLAGQGALFLAPSPADDVVSRLRGAREGGTVRLAEPLAEAASGG